VVEFFSKPSAICTKWCAQTFPPIFGLFAIFDFNFAKIVAPPSDECENYVDFLKEQSLPKKMIQTASKSTHNRQRNACSNYAPLEHTALRTRSVTNKKTKLETKASSHEGQCIPAGCRVTLPRRTLITMSVITMRSRQFPANSASDCLRFLKFRPQFCESCGAIYRWICETFSPLQRTSGPLTNSVNSVQIDA